VTVRPTDRQTDRQKDHVTWSITADHIYVRSTVMQPNNNKININDIQKPLEGYGFTGAGYLLD